MSTIVSMTKVKNALKRTNPDLIPTLKNVRINGCMQGCSGFITDRTTGRVVYISTDVNHGINQRALYRTAEHEHDFTGGRNHFCDLDAEEIVEHVRDLLSVD